MADTCSGWAAPMSGWTEASAVPRRCPRELGWVFPGRWSPRFSGKVVLLSPQRPRLAREAGLAPVPLAAGRLASEVPASWGEAPP